MGHLFAERGANHEGNSAMKLAAFQNLKMVESVEISPLEIVAAIFIRCNTNEWEKILACTESLLQGLRCVHLLINNDAKTWCNWAAPPIQHYAVQAIPVALVDRQTESFGSQ